MKKPSTHLLRALALGSAFMLAAPIQARDNSIVDRDADGDPVRGYQRQYCSRTSAHGSHWYRYEGDHSHWCPGRSASSSGGGVSSRQSMHCGYDYNHRAHWWHKRGDDHSHYCPGGPHRH